MTFAVLCPGQGAQHAGMLDLADGHAEGRRVIDEACGALGEDARAWLRNGDAIFANAIAQPLIVVAQLAQWHALRAGMPPVLAFAGYSVGELACYGLAGSYDAGALARAARTRAALMDAAAAQKAGGLAAVRGLARATVQRLCDAESAAIAIANGEDAFVVGGTVAALEAFARHAARAGAQVTSLRVGIASHTPLLAAAVAPFRDALLQSPLGSPARPVIAGIDATPVTTRERAVTTLSAQLARTVEWAQCLDALYERGCRVYLELGPGRALSKMVRERFDDVDTRSVEDFRDPAAIAPWVMTRAT